MVGANQNLNGSRVLATPILVIFCHPWTRTCYINLPIKLEVSISAHYEDMKKDSICAKCGS